MSEKFEKHDVLARQRRHWLLVAQLAFPVLLPAIFWLGTGLPPVTIVAALAASVVSSATSSYLWLRWLRESRGTLVVDQNGATIDGRVVVRRARVRTLIERKSPTGRVIVRFEPTQSVGVDFVELVLDTEEEARAAISAMRLDGARSVMRVGVTRGTTRHLAWGVVALALFVAATFAVALSHAFSMAWFIALVPVLIGLIGWSSLAVAAGADGVHISAALGRARFIPYGKISGIELDGTDARLILANGETVALCFGPVRGLRWADSQVTADQAATFVARVRERLDARASVDPSKLAASLARGGRSVPEWIADITRATDGAASFRIAAVPADALLAVVEDETAAPDARAGAAVALRRADPRPMSGERIRIAASACAEPALRVALESAAHETDESELALALDRLEVLPKKARRA